MKTTSAALLAKHDEKLSGRVRTCRLATYGNDGVSLSVQRGPDGSVRGRFSGVVTCGSVWACPCCSAAISEARRGELNVLTGWARNEGHHVAMLTLTARHRKGTGLAAFLDDLKEALRRLKQSRGWRGLGLVGHVNATEVRHGEKNGWHPHFHILLVLPASHGSLQAAGDAVEGLRSEWLRSLEKVGRTGGDAAFDVSVSAVGEYVAKFGAAEEVALGAKKGSAGSRSPFQILADAREKDPASCALFVEYVKAFKGRRQLSWSRGLKALCGVDDKADAEVSEDGAAAPADEWEAVAVWPAGTDEARDAIRRQCQLVHAVEKGGGLAEVLAVMNGPSDSEAWRKERRSCVVVE